MRNKFRLLMIGIALSLGGLIVATMMAAGAWQHRAVAQQSASKTLDTAQSIHKYVDEQRLQHLADASLGIATNPNFASSIARALHPDASAGQARDVASIRDLIDERRREAHLDAAAILDANGVVVATVGDSFLAEHNLTTLAAVVESRRNAAQASGLINDDRRIPLVSVTPLLHNATLQGLLVTGMRFDDSVLKTMAHVAQIDFALVSVPPTGPQVLSSSLDPRDSELLAKGVSARRIPLLENDTTAPTEIQLGEETWSLRTVALGPSSGKTFLLSLVPPTHREAARAAIAPALIAAMVAMLVVLLILIAVLWGSVLKPLIRIAELSERTMRGDYALEMKPAGIGLVRRIGVAFNHLLNELDGYRVSPGTPRRRATDRR
jgi:HAMP domain-containing protein